MKKMIFLIVTAFLLVAAMMIFTQNFTPPSFPDGVDPAAAAEQPAAEQTAADTGAEPESPPEQAEQTQTGETDAGDTQPESATQPEQTPKPEQTPEPEPAPTQQKPPAQPVALPPASKADLLTEAEQLELKQQMLDLIESLKE